MTGATVKLGATSLMYACQQGKESQVNKIIQTKPDTILERERSLKTALHYCAESGEGGVESAAALLRAAPELVFAKDQDGYTALHLAVIAGNVPLTKLLIAQGADVNTSDNEGHTSAHWATVCGEIECLELILKKKADPNIGDMHGGCPLHYAAQMCGPGSEMPGDRRLGMTALRLLINHFANPNISDNHGRQPILWAASAGSSEAILVLTNAGANVEAADKDGLTALHCAASRGHTDCVETLISLCNAETDVIDNNGCSALFYAVTLGHADCTQTLLNHGANTNRQDRKGRTAMHCGAAKGQMETLKVVWSRGGNLWTRTARGDYPLHEAVTSGRTDLVLWLLSLRPDAVNAPNNDGRCPLHLAAIHDNVEMCKVLLDAGSLVNPVMRTAKGMLATPLDAALHKGHRGTAKYLQVHGGVPAARLNSESAALRGPNTRNLSVQNQKPLDSEKEKSDVGEQMASRKVVQSSPKENAPMIAQKQKILQVYVEDGVMIRRIKHSQVGEVEERIKRRRRKRKIKYAVDKSYLHGKDKHGRRGYDETTDEDGYTSQESSIGECRLRTETDSDEMLKPNPENPPMTESSLPPKNESFSEVVNTEEINAMKTKISDEIVDLLPLPMKENELNSEMKYKTELTDMKSIDSITIDRNVLIDMTHSTETKVERNDIKQSETENDDKDSGAIDENSLSEKDELRTAEAKKEKIDLVKESTIGSLVENVSKVNENEYVSEAMKDNIDSENTESLNLNYNTEPKDPNQIENSEQNYDFQARESDAQSDLENDKIAAIETMNFEREAAIALEKQSESQNVETEKEERHEEGFRNAAPDNNKSSDNIIAGSDLLINEAELEKYTKTNEPNRNSSPKMEIEESKDGDTPERKEEVDDKDVTASDLYDGKEDSATEHEIEAMDSLSNEDHEQNINKDNINSDLVVISEENQVNKNSQISNEHIEKQQAMKEGNQDTIDEGINSIHSENSEQIDRQSSKGKTNDQEHSMENHEVMNVKKDEEEAYSEVKSEVEDSTVKISENEEINDPNESVTNTEDTVNVEELETLGSSILNEETKIDEESSPNVTYNMQSVVVPEQKELVLNVNEKDHKNQSGLDPEKPLEHKRTRKLEKYQAESKNERTGHGKKDRGLIKVLSDEKIPSSINKEEKIKPKHKEWKKQRSSENWETHSISPDESSILPGKSPTELPDFDVETSPRGEKHSQGTKSVGKSRIPRMCNKGQGEKTTDIPISTVSVTQAVQYSVRKYHLERRIFHQLLELKRLQIRAGRASEGVLVKRLVDDYRRAGLMLGLQQYNGVYTFRAFEKYLYDQLRLLQSSERRIIPRLKSSDDLEKLTAALRKTRAGQDILTSIPSNPALCTYQTHRCHHATHAYTGVPCAAYIKKNHHTMVKPGSFLPKLVNDEGHSELAKTLRFVDPSRPLTLELSHGSEKQVITLPTEKLDKSKRYFVTFTIKTGNQKKPEGSNVHTHASSV